MGRQYLSQRSARKTERNVPLLLWWMSPAPAADAARLNFIAAFALSCLWHQPMPPSQLLFQSCQMCHSNLGLLCLLCPSSVCLLFEVCSPVSVLSRLLLTPLSLLLPLFHICRVSLVVVVFCLYSPRQILQNKLFMPSCRLSRPCSLTVAFYLLSLSCYIRHINFSKPIRPSGLHPAPPPLCPLHQTTLPSRSISCLWTVIPVTLPSFPSASLCSLVLSLRDGYAFVSQNGHCAEY